MRNMQNTPSPIRVFQNSCDGYVYACHVVDFVLLAIIFYTKLTQHSANIYNLFYDIMTHKIIVFDK